MPSSAGFLEAKGALAGVTTKAPVWDMDPGDFERALETLPLHDLDELC